MYVCNCRQGLTESRISKFLEDHPGLPALRKVWARISEQISGEKMQCGKCLTQGEDFIRTHISSKEPV